MKFTYIGDQDSITFREVTFPRGEAVDVENESLAEKIGNLDYFEKDGAESGFTVEGNAGEVATSFADRLRGMVGE